VALGGDGKSQAVNRIRVYGTVLERPADPMGKQDIAEQLLDLFAFLKRQNELKILANF